MFQLEIKNCHQEEVQTISDTLDKTKALAITLTDEQDDAILEPPLGTTPLWPHVVITAIFEHEVELEFAKLNLSSCFPKLTFTETSLPSKDWQHASMQDWKPQRFGERLWVCPSWLPQPEGIHLKLDPGLAFGTGTHPTTALCLTWLDQAELETKTLIDYGSGSGILALAALKLGARHVTALDIDEQALIATKNNAILNQIPESALTIGPPTTETEPVDILIANILLSPLKSLRDEFQKRLKPNAILVVSGLLEDQIEALTLVYQNHFTLTESYLKEGWGLGVFKIA